MLRSSAARIVLGVVAVLAILTFLRFKPWQREGGGTVAGAPSAGSPNKTRQELTVGFLPVT